MVEGLFWSLEPSTRLSNVRWGYVSVRRSVYISPGFYGRRLSGLGVRGGGGRIVILFIYFLIRE